MELIDALKGINSLHSGSPVLRILAARRFPIAAALTRICFINPERSEVLEDELCATLDRLLDAARDILSKDGDDDRLQEVPKSYLDQWSQVRGAHWYSVHADPSGLKCYRLTPAGREAHTLLASIEAGRSVSTESRLKRFIDMATDLAARASGSPDRRISELEAQIAKAQLEIAEIKRTGQVAEIPRRELLATFDELLRLHGAIGADLDQVRELIAGHRASTQDIVMTSDAAKGQLLDIVWAGEDEVRATDEYASLAAFRQLLSDDQLRLKTRQTVEELKGNPVIHERFIATGKVPARFDGAVESFFDRSRKIDTEFTGYYEQLRGIVVREDIDEMRAVSRMHKVLSSQFVDVRDRLEPSPRDRRLDGIGIVLPGTALKPHPASHIHFAIDVAAGSQVAPKTESAENESDPLAFELEMRRQADIAPDQLRLKIAIAWQKSGCDRVNLDEVLDLFPLRYGFLELSAFLELAIQHVPSEFDRDRTANVQLTDEFQDTTGQTQCTYFNPTFLTSGEAGAGLEGIHCILPEAPEKTRSLLAQGPPRATPHRSKAPNGNSNPPKPWSHSRTGADSNAADRGDPNA